MLVVDDVELNRALLREQLSFLGFAVTTVEGGELAVSAALEGGFDLILMDCEMPGVDGFEAARRIRQAGVQAPVLALTGHSSEDIKTLCLRAGMNGLVTKPVGTEALGAALAPWLK